MPDIFDAYQKALTELLAALGSGHPDYGDALLYQARLTETMSRARRFGDTESLRAERAQIIDGLNRCLLYTSPSPRDRTRSRMPSSA